MTRRVLKWPVPVDDLPHEIGAGEVVLVARQERLILNVWTVEDTDDHTTRPYAQVFGTGHPLPEGAEPIGSVLDGPFVWHVMKVSH